MKRNGRSYSVASFKPGDHGDDFDGADTFVLQRLRIKVRLPKKVTEHNFPLVLAQEKSNLLKVLLDACKLRTKTETNGQTWLLEYFGERIFLAQTAEYRPLFYIHGHIYHFDRWIRVEITEEKRVRA
jgi:hypothetical protein